MGTPGEVEKEERGGEWMWEQEIIGCMLPPHPPRLRKDPRGGESIGKGEKNNKFGKIFFGVFMPRTTPHITPYGPHLHCNPCTTTDLSFFKRAIFSCFVTLGFLAVGVNSCKKEINTKKRVKKMTSPHSALSNE